MTFAESQWIADRATRVYALELRLVDLRSYCATSDERPLTRGNTRSVLERTPDCIIDEDEGLPPCEGPDCDPPASAV